MPDFLPIENIVQKKVNFGTEFKIINQIDFTKNIDIQKFSPLIYKNRPWKISQVTKLKKDAIPILTFQNDPLIVEGKYHQGTVIFSGLNLPFHIIENNNFEEAKLFKNIVLALIGETNYPQISYKVQRPKPEEIEVTADKISGIYFKENYDPGWQASLKDPSGDQKLKIYKAGLDFMYIPLSQAAQSLKISINYKGNLISWALYYVSIIALILTFIFLFLPKKVKVIISKIFSKTIKTIFQKVVKFANDENI